MKKPSPQRVAELNQGAESTNLMEVLSIDFNQLLFNTLQLTSEPMSGGILQRMQASCSLLIKHFDFTYIYELRSHPNDTIRGIVCYAIAQQSLPLAEKIKLMLPLADDANAGVREWAWLSLRPYVAEELNNAIKLLGPLTLHSSERIRRFAAEITRPRGVWCASIKQLRTAPQLALIIIEPLKTDASLYVQKSVGNWLNDAAKDHPSWVEQITQKWLEESPHKSTHYIAKRALRSLKK